MPMFYLARNDLLPVLTVTPKDGDGATVVIANGATVVFNLITVNGGAVKVSRGAAVALSGALSYTWASGDTDTAGDFRGEFEWNNGGKPETFPNHKAGELIVRIHPDIA